MPHLDRLYYLSQRVSGRAYARWLEEAVFDAFSGHQPLRRRDLVALNFPNSVAVLRLNHVLRRLHIQSPDHLLRLHAVDLARVTGVGERQLLAACVVLEAYGAPDADINAWLDSLSATPHRSIRAAAAEAARTGAKGRHDV